MEERIKKLEQRVAALENIVARQEQAVSSHYSIGTDGVVFIQTQCQHYWQEINGTVTYLQCKKCGAVQV